MPTEFHSKLQCELQNAQRHLAQRSQSRFLAETAGVNLCSNDYLGLAEHPALKEAVLEAVSEAPRMSGTGSRLLSGHAIVWEELESEFARFAGTEDALYFGSGYSANLGLLTSLLRKSDLVFSDALNHASLIDGMRLSGASREIYPHLDLNALEDALRARSAISCRKLIVTETVFSMDGDVAPLAEIFALADRYGAGVILDEAHATVVHGPAGRGMAAQADLLQHVVAVVHTCGKALASAGAFVCGSSLLKEHLINHARTFIFSTAMPPYMARQIQAALRLAQGMDVQRDHLREKSRRFAAALAADGWDTAGSATQIVPAITGGNDEALAAADFLQREGFAVRAIRPPTVPEGRSRLRFSLTAATPERELERLREVLAAWSASECRSAAAGCA
ncbi:MAG TPA: 8-amino-7-oxononanoate synthase [Candidatus Dormibacteraeota bacterium]|nr:8-amino-7-oxononanoate synthase [Candidatus Dormibacteraeota bacterium]